MSTRADLPPAPAWEWRGLAATIIPLRFIIGGLFGLFAMQHVLLWRFIGFANWPTLLLGAVVSCGLAVAVSRSAPTEGVPLGRLLLLIGVGVALFVLGGEGRLLFANFDWQIRDAVMHDMTANPWPFVYTVRGVPEILRTPAAMYLLPSLLGKVLGFGATTWLLLLQNGIVLGSTLAIASTLFTGRWTRVAALVVAVWFSGMDLLGAAWKVLFGGFPIPSSIEVWSGLQFSSHIMQILWAPHHGLPGWFLATLYLLWRAGRMSPGPLFAAAPLVALSSPLVVLGALPFAAHAGFEALRRRSLRPADLAIPLFATLLAVPALLYMTAGSQDVPMGMFHLDSVRSYIKLLLFEAVPFLFAGVVLVWRGRFGGATLVIAALVLVTVPLLQVSKGIDFCMRVSIPALAILCAVSIDALKRWALDEAVGGMRRLAGWALVITLLIGSWTGVSELARSIYLAPQTPSRCSLFSAWQQALHPYRNDVGSYSVYIAPVASLPFWMRPAQASVVDSARDPARCFARPWMAPRNLS